MWRYEDSDYKEDELPPVVAQFERRDKRVEELPPEVCTFFVDVIMTVLSLSDVEMSSVDMMAVAMNRAIPGKDNLARLFDKFINDPASHHTGESHDCFNLRDELLNAVDNPLPSIERIRTEFARRDAVSSASDEDLMQLSLGVVALRQATCYVEDTLYDVLDVLESDEDYIGMFDSFFFRLAVAWCVFSGRPLSMVEHTFNKLRRDIDTVLEERQWLGKDTSSMELQLGDIWIHLEVDADEHATGYVLADTPPMSYMLELALTYVFCNEHGVSPSYTATNTAPVADTFRTHFLSTDELSQTCSAAQPQSLSSQPDHGPPPDAYMSPQGRISRRSGEIALLESSTTARHVLERMIPRLETAKHCLLTYTALSTVATPSTKQYVRVEDSFLARPLALQRPYSDTRASSQKPARIKPNSPWRLTPKW